MIPPFSRPSDPSKKVTLREATVSDCLDFAGVDAGHEEEVTTLFLNRVQDKATFTDSRTWTGEERRLALFWYWLHTSKDFEVVLSYLCQHCGEKHQFIQDFRNMAEGYTEIQGMAEREFEFKGDTWIVRPINGAGMETLELMQLGLDSIGDEKSGAYRKQEALIRLARLELSVDFKKPDSLIEKASILFKRKGKPEDTEAEKTQYLAAKRKKLTAMLSTEFEEFASIVMDKLAEMKHGLESETEDGRITLITPPHQCPNKKEGMTRLRVNFRNSDYIPGL